MANNTSSPVDYQYLCKGIYALSRAHRANTMAGHLGAAVAAGYFIGEQRPDLDPFIFTNIETELDRIIEGQSVFSPQPDAAITVAELFESIPTDEAREDLIDTIPQALAKNIGEAHESGHNVIFASIALRAFKDHPELAAPSIINGICQLITAFDGSSPGSGYYGAERGRINGNLIDLPEDQDFPPYSDLRSMVRMVLNELLLSAPEKRQGYGGLVHIINHAAALCELAAYGYPQLAVEGLKGHHQHVRLWKTLPNVADETEPEAPVENDLWSPEYWRPGNLRPGAARLTHRIKTFYGFYTLLDFLDDPSGARQSEDMLRYLM